MTSTIIRAIAIFLLSIVISCSVGNSDNVPSFAPLLQVSNLLTFTDTVVPMVKTANLIIDNTDGTGPADITDLIGLSLPFSIISPTTLPTTVPAGGTLTIQIQFAPTSIAPYADSLQVNTTDPNKLSIPVTVTGNGIDMPREDIAVTGLYIHSRPVSLTDTTFLENTSGMDGIDGNSDNIIVFLDISPPPATKTNINIPGLSTPATRLGNTTALVASAGADNIYETYDDGVYLIDISALPPTFIPIPGLTSDMASQPVKFTPFWFTENLAAVSTYGSDSLWGTADDTIVGINVSTPIYTNSIVVGGLTTKLASQPTHITGYMAFVATGGPDNTFGDSDDEVVSVDINALTANHITVPYLDANMSKIVSQDFSHQLSLLASPGPDTAFGSSDDIFYFLTWDGISLSYSLGGPIVRYGALSIPVRLSPSDSLLPYSADGISNANDAIDKFTYGSSPISYVIGGLIFGFRSQPVPLENYRFAVATSGPNSIAGDSDDTLLKFSISSTTPLSSATVGGLLDDASQPSAISENFFAISTTGPNGIAQSDDDTVVFVDLSLPTPISKTVVGLSSDTRSRPVAISSSMVFLVVSAGSNLTFGNGDDVIVKFGPIP